MVQKWLEVNGKFNMEKIENRYAVDLPDPWNLDTEWRMIESFNSKSEALEFVQKKFGADEQGRINLITELT